MNRLPPSILKEFQSILRTIDSNKIQLLKDTLTNDPYILSHVYYDYYGRYKRYCVISLLCGLHTDKFYGKSTYDKITAARAFAHSVRGEDPCKLEEYLMNRYILLPPSKKTHYLLSKEEVQDIIDCCDQALKRGDQVLKKATI
jgi:hypothetical protein